MIVHIFYSAFMKLIHIHHLLQAKFHKQLWWRLLRLFDEWKMLIWQLIRINSQLIIYLLLTNLDSLLKNYHVTKFCEKYNEQIFFQIHENFVNMNWFITLIYKKKILMYSEEQNIHEIIFKHNQNSAMKIWKIINYELIVN